MAKKNENPSRFITIEIFEDNLTSFKGDTLSERVTDWLSTSVISREPVVISPLHTPDDGRKPHVHIVVDVTNFEHRSLDWFQGFCKSYSLPRPENVRNIYCMELYLTHDTAQARLEEKQTFSPAERDTMLFINGYTMHEQTDRAKREELSVVIAMISERIEDAIDNGVSSDNRSLSRMLRDPAFYSEIECAMPFDVLKAKARNELKTHWRYYQEYASDYKTDKERKEIKALEKAQKQSREELREDNAQFGSYLISILSTLSERECHNAFNCVYGNDKDFRKQIIDKFGGGHIQTLNHRAILESFITYCVIENSMPDRLITLLNLLQQYTTNCFTGNSLLTGIKL